MTIQVEKYGKMISSNTIGDLILSEIKKNISKYQEVVIDFMNVKSMATYNAKQIFGQLYLELGAEKFFSNIKIANASPSILSIIKLGIMDSLKDRDLQTV